MNAEILKLIQINDGTDEFSHKPERIPEIEMLEKLKSLHVNLSKLYELNRHDDIDIDYFSNQIADNIAILLKMFSEMGVYPSLFFELLIKMKIDCQKKYGTSDYDSLGKNYFLYHRMNYGKALEELFKKRIYSIQIYSNKDVSDAYKDTIKLLESYGIPHNINTKEYCSKIYEEIERNHSAIANELLNSDDIYEDVEYMTKLLLEYLSFFAAMGIDPKEMVEKNLFKKKDHKKK